MNTEIIWDDKVAQEYADFFKKSDYSNHTTALKSFKEAKKEEQDFYDVICLSLRDVVEATGNTASNYKENPHFLRLLDLVKIKNPQLLS